MYLNYFSQNSARYLIAPYFSFFIFFKVNVIHYAITVVPFSTPLYSPLLCTHLPPTFPPPLSSCPWVIHISSLASPFPILFLTFPCLFCTYQLGFLFPVPFSPILFPHALPTENSPSDLHFCDSVPYSSCFLSLFCFVF